MVRFLNPAHAYRAIYKTLWRMNERHWGFGVANAANENAPRAYTGPYPILSHRTLAEVWGIDPNGGAA